MNVLIKLVIFLSCFNDKFLLTVCEEELIYGVRDRNGTMLFSLHLNGTDKPAESSFLFNIDFKTVNYISSMQCIGNKFFISTNDDHQYASKLFQFSLNGVITFSATFPKYQNIEIRHDWLTGNLYLTSRKKIMVAIPEEKSNQTLKTKTVMSSTDYINDLALNPNSGLMYFSIDNKIMQANMDGSGLKDFVSNDIFRPTKLALNLAREKDERLYFRDIRFSKKSVEFIKLGGSERGVILQGGNNDVIHHSSLNNYEDQLIYIDNNYKFKSINKNNGSEVWTWERPLSHRYLEFVSHFTICDMRNQPIRRRNPCDGANCSYLCVLSAGSNEGFECLCPDGKFLDLDGISCKESSLAMAEENHIKLIGLDVIGTGEFETIVMREMKSIKAFCYNPRNHAFILYDSVLKNIFEYNLITKDMKLLVGSQIGNVEDVGIDVVAQNLYWIDSERQSLEVMGLESNARRILKLDLEENPTQIFVPFDPNLGIFTVGKGWIREYSRDGSSLMIFSDPGSQPIGLTYDLASDNFFWIEGAKGRIFSSRRIRNDNKVKTNSFIGPVRNGVIHEGSVYWIPENVEELRYTKIGSNNISKVELKGLGDAKLVILNRELEHNSLIYLREHECSWRNIKRKNCSHICIPSGNSLGDWKGECFCPDGYELGEDELTCERQKECNEMPTQFGCNDGTCIPGLFVCDGIKDCGGNEDEVEELCSKWKPTPKPDNFTEAHGESTRNEDSQSKCCCGESNGNNWIVSFLALVIIAIGSACGGIFIYKKIISGANRHSGSLSLMLRRDSSVERRTSNL